MSELDKYYQILGLNPGASEKEIKEAYRDLVNVWHPDRFSDNPRLREKANEKTKEINLAYEKLKSCIAGETSTTSEEKSCDESQPPPHEPPPQSEKDQDTTTDDTGQGDFEPPPEQPSGRPQPHVVKSIYAGFWNRFAASFIDSLIIAAASAMLSLPYLIAKGFSRTTSSSFWVVFDSIFFMLIGWLYYTVLESSTKRATIGKMAVGIIVTDINGNRISFGCASGRWLGKIISSLILGIGYIMAGFTQKKQALHDIMADTLVLERPEGVRSWLATTIIGGQAVILLVSILFLTLNRLNRHTTRTADYTQTASAPSSSLSMEQPTSTQLESLVPSTTSPPARPTATVGETQEGEKKQPEESSITNESGEVEGIKDLLEKVRQANLQKNIDLFMSCYSTDFKDREGKRRATLESWKKFDYLDLSYDLKEHSISTYTAQAYVEWLMRISPKIGGKPQESKTVLDVTLKREDGSWRIKETRLVS